MNRLKIARICLEVVCLSFLSILFYYYNLGYLNLVIFFVVLIDNIYIISKLLKQGNRDTVISDNIS